LQLQSKTICSLGLPLKNEGLWNGPPLRRQPRVLSGTWRRKDHGD
jgi:hypothetical protein